MPPNRDTGSGWTPGRTDHGENSSPVAPAGSGPGLRCGFPTDAPSTTEGDDAKGPKGADE